MLLGFYLPQRWQMLAIGGRCEFVGKRTIHANTEMIQKQFVVVLFSFLKEGLRSIGKMIF
jgi:hypothetical protein